MPPFSIQFSIVFHSEKNPMRQNGAKMNKRIGVQFAFLPDENEAE
jgi:hypothetical protein